MIKQILIICMLVLLVGCNQEEENPNYDICENGCRESGYNYSAFLNITGDYYCVCGDSIEEVSNPKITTNATLTETTTANISIGNYYNLTCNKTISYNETMILIDGEIKELGIVKHECIEEEKLELINEWYPCESKKCIYESVLANGKLIRRIIIQNENYIETNSTNATISIGSVVEPFTTDDWIEIKPPMDINVTLNVGDTYTVESAVFPEYLDEIGNYKYGRMINPFSSIATPFNDVMEVRIDGMKYERCTEVKYKVEEYDAKGRPSILKPFEDDSGCHSIIYTFRFCDVESDCND